VDSECAESSSGYAGLFEDWEIAIAGKLVNKYRDRWTCLELEEIDDLMQECLMAWWRARDSYEPSRGASRRTFMGRVVRNKLMDIVRARDTDKRRVNYVAVSLDEPLGDDESSATLAEELDEVAGACDRRDAVSQIELRLDLERATENLTSRQRKICRHLKDGYSITELAQLLATPRGTIYDEMRRIRRSFAKRGLEDYLR